METICLTCHDKGWVVYQGNESFSCPDCLGRHFDHTANMLKHSGIPEAKREQRFESFKKLPGTEPALAAVKLLTNDPQPDSKDVIMVLIYGNTGSGKTHLAHASGLHAIQRGIPAKFVRCDALLREFKSAKSQDQEKYDELFRYYTERLYLIIDDLDWGTDADLRMIEELICSREANHLLTLITTNRNLGEIESALPRVMSRFRDERFARVVYNKASDYRRRQSRDKIKK